MGVSFWKKKEVERSEKHGKEYSAQEGLLAKLVAAPGEYDRKEELDIDDLIRKEEEEKAKAGEEETESEDEEEIGSDEISSTLSNDKLAETGDATEEKDEVEYTEA